MSSYQRPAKSSDRDPLVPITGLWAHYDKNGNVYYSGSSGSNRWLVLPVMGANGEPDYRLYISSNTKHRIEEGQPEEEVYEEVAAK